LPEGDADDDALDLGRFSDDDGGRTLKSIGDVDVGVGLRWRL